MIQPERLECGLKSVVQMKSQQDDQHDVNDRIGLIGKKVEYHAVKIVVVSNPFCSLRRAGYSGFDQVKIHQVNDKEHADHNTGVDHELGEKRSV